MPSSFSSEFFDIAPPIRDDKAGRKNSRQDAQCFVGGAISFILTL
jgi:hypothetical protein